MCDHAASWIHAERNLKGLYREKLLTAASVLGHPWLNAEADLDIIC